VEILDWNSDLNYTKGDRVGVMLDFVSGTLRIFKNGYCLHLDGRPCLIFKDPRITGPMVPSVQLFVVDQSVRLHEHRDMYAEFNSKLHAVLITKPD
jgi:hypothetical protein